MITQLIKRLTKNGKVLDKNVDEDLDGPIKPVLCYCAYGSEPGLAVPVMVPRMHSPQSLIGCMVIECMNRVEQDIIEQDPAECFYT